METDMKLRKAQLGVALVGLIAIFAAYTYWYINDVSEQIYSDTVDQILQSDKNDIENINSSLKSKQSQLTPYLNQLISVCQNNKTDIDNEDKLKTEIDNILKTIDNDENARCSFFNYNNIDYICDNIDIKINNENVSIIDKINKDVVKSDKVSICGILQDYENKQVLIVYSIPVTLKSDSDKESKKTGYLYVVETLSSLMNNPVSNFEENESKLIVNSEGIIAANLNYNDKSSSTRLADRLKTLGINESKVKQVVQDIKNNKNGYIVLDREDKDNSILSYIPFDTDSGWSIISIVKANNIISNTNIIFKYVIIMSTILLIVVIVFLIYIIYVDKNVNERIRKLAYKDQITGIGNQNYMEEEFKNFLQQNQNQKYAYIIFDMDNFKFINNTMGYERGNIVLNIVAEEVTRNIDSNCETVIRISGDVFAALLIYTDKYQLVDRVESIFDKIKEHIYDRFNMNFHILFSCGISLINDISTPLQSIKDAADIARKNVKFQFDRQIDFYSEDMEIEIQQRNEVEEEMESALKNNEFKVYLQPKINMMSSKLVGAEALVRWEHKKKGMIPPNKFINIFEKNGFIINLDMYMFEEVCKLKKRWKSENRYNVLISVNMSRLHIQNDNFVDELLEIAERYDVDPADLEIEVTENAFFEDSDLLLEVTNELKENGFMVSIDDFGSGYSSLNILKDIPVDIIKIDRKLLQLTDNDIRGQKILKSIISMSKELELDIVTEGVENQEQVDMLTSFGCEIAQGYYYSKPLDIRSFEQYAMDHEPVEEVVIEYLFKDNFNSEDGMHNAEFVGDKYSFTEGVYPGSKGLRLVGSAPLTDYLKIPTDILTEDYSISFWIKPESFLQFTSVIFVKYEDGFMEYMPAAWPGAMSYRIKKGFNEEIGWNDTSYKRIIKENEWAHIVLTYNSEINTARLFVNGENVSSRLYVADLHNVLEISIGSDEYQTGYQGTIANLRFFNRVLASSEIRIHYEEERDRM